MSDTNESTRKGEAMMLRYVGIEGASHVPCQSKFVIVFEAWVNGKLQQYRRRLETGSHFDEAKQLDLFNATINTQLGTMII